MKHFVLIGAIVVLLSLLAGGAFTTVQLLAKPQTETPASGGGGGRVMESVQVGNDGVPVNVQTTILPAAELPDEEATAFGIVLSRRDDALTLGTGAIELSVDIEIDPTKVVKSPSRRKLDLSPTAEKLMKAWKSRCGANNGATA